MTDLPNELLLVAANLCTSHLTGTTVQALEQYTGFGAVAVLMADVREGGLLLYTDDDATAYTLDDAPDDLKALVQWMRRHQVRYCRLDGGSAEAVDLPVYEW